MHRVLSFMATTVKVKCNVNFIFLQDTAAGLVVFIAFVCVNDNAPPVYYVKWLLWWTVRDNMSPQSLFMP